MSTSDGYVGSSVKVVDHGSPGSRWNLVIVGDGYLASDLGQYHTDVRNFIDEIYNTAPFNELWCGINVYRVDVVSLERGADDSTLCPGGTGATPRTYFDSRFCSPWNGGYLDRLMSCDSNLAKTVAQSAIPGFVVHQVLVMVNSSKYGGGGGTVAMCSTSAPQIAIHEMGHSAFGLADEYEGSGTHTGGEPLKPNVTIDTNRATNKWRDLIAATTPMPSACYADCPTCASPSTPPPAGAVGTYEGGMYKHCGIFRPLPNCYMRDYQPFCPVCARVIRQTIQPLLPPESITLVTPSITFHHVPEGMGGTGVTTHRAVVFEVGSCRSLTFRITAGPTGGFGTPFGAVVMLSPSKTTPVDYARVWLSYTSTAAGATSSGDVTIQCDQTMQSWTVHIEADTVARPKAAVTLVLDSSGSMSEDAGDGTTKVQKLRQATGIFVNTMLQGDGVGIVRFNQAAQRLMDVTDVGPAVGGAGRAAAVAHINSAGLDPGGTTSIGDGVLKGKQALDDAQATASPPYDVTAMVVLSDGMENTAPMLSTVGASISANTFAIGLGLPYNISTTALNALTQGHNGYLLITGLLTPDQSTRLTKYFLQVLAGISNANVVLDPKGQLSPGVVHRIPFPINEADMGIDVILLTAIPQAVSFQLETPDGSMIDPAAAVALGTATYVTHAGLAYYRASLPAIPAAPNGSHGGAWQAVLKLAVSAKELERYAKELAEHPDQDLFARGLLPYDLIVHAYSNLAFSAAAHQMSYEPGSKVHLAATLREYDVPVENRAGVWAEVLRPDDSVQLVSLHEEEPGRFAASFKANLSGVYALRTRARGETFRGTPFEREQTLTAVAYPGGDRPRRELEASQLCQFLDCLLRKGVLDDKLLERLAAEGLDLKKLVPCLKAHCVDPVADAERHMGAGVRFADTSQLTEA